MPRIMYCPVCGNNREFQQRVCHMCNTKVSPKASNHDCEYYKNKSKEKYGNPNLFYKILLEEEILKNSLYDKTKSIMNIKSVSNAGRTVTPKQTDSNIPKCPTCGSTNIKKISSVSKAAHGLAFGLFSKTARSQFECLNCHYKW